MPFNIDSKIHKVTYVIHELDKLRDLLTQTEIEPLTTPTRVIVISDCDEITVEIQQLCVNKFYTSLTKKQVNLHHLKSILNRWHYDQLMDTKYYTGVYYVRTLNSLNLLFNNTCVMHLPPPFKIVIGKDKAFSNKYTYSVTVYTLSGQPDGWILLMTLTGIENIKEFATVVDKEHDEVLEVVKKPNTLRLSTESSVKRTSSGFARPGEAREGRIETPPIPIDANK